ncbi:MAG: hypothetical protein Q8J69_11015 [Sphingobacteriaceae bacterium]|jgi:hypothetical protein|nr:hypothetical protein [Sphingobacteriaceae bacterium]
MATELKATPVLKGKESKRFNDKIANSKANKISTVKKEKMFSLVGKVLAKNA